MRQRRNGADHPERRRHRGGGRDDGFLLLETVIAITIITVVMAALTTLLIDSSRSTVRQRSAQAAAQIAVSALDKANSLGGADAVHGRDQTSVSAQFSSLLAQRASVSSWLAGMTPAVDADADPNQGANAKRTPLPTVPVTESAHGSTYNVSYFVGNCWRPALGSGDCVATKAAAAAAQSGQVSAIQSVPVPYVRVVTVVVWNAAGCPTAGCDYESAIVLNSQPDPVFNFDQTAPSGPKLLPVHNPQTSAAGAAVNGVSGVGDCNVNCPITATGGVSPLIFSGTVQLGSGTVATLTTDTACASDGASGSPSASPTGSATASPTGSATATASGSASATPSSSPSVDASASYGFMLDPTCGLITGTPTAAGTYTFTISVVDSFLNSDSTTFTWKVGGTALAFTAPGAQTNAVGDTVNVAMTGATGGSTPYTWSASNLPPGLKIDSSTGAITGKVTSGAASPYTVTVTLSDSASPKATVSHTITWTVPTSTLSITAPSPTSGAAWSPVSASANFVCPSGSCSFKLTGNPGWMSLSTTSTTSKSGTVSLSGTPTTVASYSNITITITDRTSWGKSASAGFSWKVTAAAPPTIDPIANQKLPSRGLTVTPSFTCPLTSCVFSLDAQQKSGSRSLPSSFSYHGSWSPSEVGSFLGFNSSTGAFTVSSSLAGMGSSLGYWSYQVTITITDKSGASASSSFTLSSS